MTLLVIVAVVFLASFLPMLWIARRAYVKQHGKRTVKCPETDRLATVRLDGRHAAWTAALGDPDLRIAGCSEWPERGTCGQECLNQTQTAAE